MIANQVRAFGLALLILMSPGVAPVSAGQATPGEDEETPQRPARRPGLLPLSLAVEADLGSRAVGPAVFHEGFLVIATAAGEVMSLDAATLEARWKLGLPQSELFPPLLLPNAILVASRSGSLMLLDPGTGAIQAEISIGSSLAAAPSWDGETLFLATDERDVMAYDIDTKKEIWRTRLQDPALTLTPRAPLLLVSDRSGGLNALESATGALRWQFQGRGNFEAPARFDEAGERLYLGDTGGYFYSIAARDGKVHYRWPLGAAIVDPVLLEEDRLFVVSYANTLFCYRTGNGHELWRANLPGRPAAAPFRVRRRVVVLTLNRRVIEFAAGGQPAPQVYVPPEDVLPYPVLLPQGFLLPLRSGQLLLLRTARPAPSDEATDPEDDLEEPGEQDLPEDLGDELDEPTISGATLPRTELSSKPAGNFRLPN